MRIIIPCPWACVQMDGEIIHYVPICAWMRDAWVNCKNDKPEITHCVPLSELHAVLLSCDLFGVKELSCLVAEYGVELLFGPSPRLCTWDYPSPPDETAVLPRVVTEREILAQRFDGPCHLHTMISVGDIVDLHVRLLIGVAAVGTAVGILPLPAPAMDTVCHSRDGHHCIFSRELPPDSLRPLPTARTFTLRPASEPTFFLEQIIAVNPMRLLICDVPRHCTLELISARIRSARVCST